MNSNNMFCLKIKCHQYWPKKKKDNDKFVWNDVGLSVEFISKANHGFYVHSILKLVTIGFYVKLFIK